MWLTNMPKVRVKQYEQGWVVEREFKTWYGRKYWKHIISPHGFEKEPWYFETKESANKQTMKYFEWDVNINS